MSPCTRLNSLIASIRLVLGAQFGVVHIGKRHRTPSPSNYVTFIGSIAGENKVELWHRSEPDYHWFEQVILQRVV